MRLSEEEYTAIMSRKTREQVERERDQLLRIELQRRLLPLLESFDTYRAFLAALDSLKAEGWTVGKSARNGCVTMTAEGGKPTFDGAPLAQMLISRMTQAETTQTS